MEECGKCVEGSSLIVRYLLVKFGDESEEKI